MEVMPSQVRFCMWQGGLDLGEAEEEPPGAQPRLSAPRVLGNHTCSVGEVHAGMGTVVGVRNPRGAGEGGGSHLRKLVRHAEAKLRVVSGIPKAGPRVLHSRHCDLGGRGGGVWMGPMLKRLRLTGRRDRHCQHCWLPQ